MVTTAARSGKTDDKRCSGKHYCSTTRSDKAEAHAHEEGQASEGARQEAVFAKIVSADARALKRRRAELAKKPHVFNLISPR